MQNTGPDSTTESRVIHVSVAVMMKDGKILISKRPAHVHQGGFWEFPGGKVENGETIESALYREINEELGIEIKDSRPLIKLLHHYSDKSVLLEARLVTDFDGQEYVSDKEHFGREGQKVKWLDREQLSSEQFPAANKGIINALLLPETYVITPDDFSVRNEASFGQMEARFIKRFSEVAQKHQLIQLRIKSLGKEKLFPLVKKAIHIAQKYQARVLLNSAMPLDDELKQLACGIHLTTHHLYETDYVERYCEHFPAKIIAASCHNSKDIKRANTLKLNFIVLSPVQYTESHPEHKSLGWAQFEALTEISTTPVYALGGMTEKDISKAQNTGAQGIAAIRSLWTVCSEKQIRS